MSNNAIPELKYRSNICTFKAKYISRYYLAPQNTRVCLHVEGRAVYYKRDGPVWSNISYVTVMITKSLIITLGLYGLEYIQHSGLNFVRHILECITIAYQNLIV